MDAGAQRSTQKWKLMPAQVSRQGKSTSVDQELLVVTAQLLQIQHCVCLASLADRHHMAEGAADAPLLPLYSRPALPKALLCQPPEGKLQ